VARRKRPLPGQESFQIVEGTLEVEKYPDDGPSVIMRRYNLEHAQNTAKRRKDRKGELKLNKRTTTFNRKTRKLWIPGSGTEHSYVIHCPESLIVMNAQSARERVKEKYRDDETVSTKQANAWGNYAASMSRPESMKKFISYNVDSSVNMLSLSYALKDSEVSGAIGEYTADSIRSSDQAIRGVSRYLYTLRSFVGANRQGDHIRRQWLQDRWVNKIAEAEEWAGNIIEEASDQVLEELYDESYYNYRSRLGFWTGVINRISEQERKSLSEPPAVELMPIEYYERYYDF